MKRIKKPIFTGNSISDDFLRNKANQPPQVSALMAQGVSQYRKETLAGEVAQGLYRDGSGPAFNENGQTPNANVVSLVGMKKQAQVMGSGGGNGFGGYGGGDTAKQIPEVYSPLWLSSNLNLPRDRATINAWCRAFYALNPFVHNAIQLHSTYPISKLSIKCPNPKIQQFFDEMIEELDLINVCTQIAQEYWLLGEAFIHTDLDLNRGKWSRIMIQNPDYMIVKRTAIASEPIIMLKPDENLKNIVKSNRPSDVEQRKQLNPYIIDAVRRGENIPLDNFHVTHLARKISPYEIRGTGLPVCIFRQLMLMDKIRESKFAQADNMINPLTLVKIGGNGPDAQHPTFADLEAWRETFQCHDEETEVLTDQGFKRFDEAIDFINGSILGKLTATPKPNIKIACFNPNNEQLEYHNPSAAFVSNYDDDMYHLANYKVDIKVTPNHKMWISEKQYQFNGHRSLRKTYWGEWEKKEMKYLDINKCHRIRSQINWIGDNKPKEVDVCGKMIPIELYLQFLGYLISEGHLYSNGKYQHIVSYCQSMKKYQSKMALCFKRFMTHYGKSYSENLVKRSEKVSKWSDMWKAVVSGKDLYEYFVREIGDDFGNTKAPFKRIPRWILGLSPRLMKILLEALVEGDGSQNKNLKNGTGFSYYTTSKQLADDVYELVYKCGFVPTVFMRNDDNYLIKDDNCNRIPLYTIMWSDTNKGTFPLVSKTSRNSQTKVKHNMLSIEKYKGKVWCFEVPTGLFITRRRGKITIQGNSAQYDKDFKIFTHPDVTVERVGYATGIYDTSPDVTQLVKEIFIGLQVPPVLMDGAEITYANGTVSLDALRQRYMQFRTMLSIFLKRKIFAPISEMQGFYDNKDGKKRLIVPDIDWNHMSLFDTNDYISQLVTLTQSAGEGMPARASLHTLYRSLGLEWEDEQRKLRKEAIQGEIVRQEVIALQALTLTELRALDENEDIPEPANGEAKEKPVPGEMPGGPGGMPDLGGGLPGLGSLPSLPGGGSTPPPIPEAPPSAAPSAPSPPTK